MPFLLGCGAETEILWDNFYAVVLRAVQVLLEDLAVRRHRVTRCIPRKPLRDPLVHVHGDVDDLRRAVVPGDGLSLLDVLVRTRFSAF